jgi:hypothetical protein
MTLTAEFEADPIVHTATFFAGASGSLQGTTPQMVPHGGATTAVEAVAHREYVFDRWSDGSEENPRTLTLVTADTVLTASFRAAGTIAPEGTFLAVVDAASRGLWDLSGSYNAMAKGSPLALALVHDTKGRLGGTAAYTVAKDTVVAMPITGAVKGTSGSIAMKGVLKGADLAKTVSVSLTLNLTVDTANRLLTGPLTGSLEANGGTTPVNENLSMPIPTPMDGTWTLRFGLVHAAESVTGSAVLTLSQGVDYAFLVKGKIVGEATVLSLIGDPGTPAARALKMWATMAPLEGGWARLESFSGKGYGQALAW